MQDILSTSEITRLMSYLGYPTHDDNGDWLPKAAATAMALANKHRPSQLLPTIIAEEYAKH